MTTRDCPWCGLPMEIVRTWTHRAKTAYEHGVETVETEMATARCLNDHWYGGPAADIEEDPA